MVDICQHGYSFIPQKFLRVFISIALITLSLAFVYATPERAWAAPGPYSGPHGDDVYVILIDTELPGDESNTQYLVRSISHIGPYNIDCDNDGIWDHTTTTDDVLCEYSTPGTYSVVISLGGLSPRPNHADDEKLLEIQQWGSQQWQSMVQAFYQASNMQITATDTPDLTNVTRMDAMFREATAFNSNISNWDVSNVTDMSSMFEGATSFNQPLNNWDVDNVTHMGSMFAGATAFNQPLDNWNIGNVTNMDGMFMGATAFNQPLDNWDVSNVVDMPLTFAGASSYDQSLASWDVKNVQNMMFMFGNLDKFLEDMLEGIPYEEWDDYYKELYGLPQSGLSFENYDDTLSAWSDLGLQEDVNFDAGTSSYCEAESQRQHIINTFNWTINDQGLDCTEPEPEPEPTPTTTIPPVTTKPPTTSKPVKTTTPVPTVPSLPTTRPTTVQTVAPTAPTTTTAPTDTTETTRPYTQPSETTPTSDDEGQTSSVLPETQENKPFLLLGVFSATGSNAFDALLIASVLMVGGAIIYFITRRRKEERH